MAFEHSHYLPETFSEKLALFVTRVLKKTLNFFYGKHLAKRAMLLETVAAVPGMVAGIFNHLKALRRMKDDGGWIKELLDEADNERMHLMIFLKVTKPSIIERILVMALQFIFILVYGLIYLFSSKTAHRIVGYFEEEACNSYSEYISQIQAGLLPNPLAPSIAIKYYDLPDSASFLDVLVCIRDDEAEHRDKNHNIADLYKNNQLPEHQS
ncbi:alternative oxidase [Photobacterium alginatilyticum]|uniref:Oxidase n=1 Tax=Photobacterium alginatilyticum TaxID=1775171 RepID=A0ABW9YCC1_9GAMM|nr:alternative oxidase [Photobacterium alginatilyticum]NBI51208.1 oxidase [Photobacterium alginatilyticum]